MHLITGPPTATDTLIKIQFMQISLVFNLITFTVPGSYRGYTILSHYVPLDLWLSQTFLFLMTESFREPWSMPSIGACLMFLSLAWSLWVLGRKTAEVKCHSHHLLSRVCIISVTCTLILTGISWLRQFFWLLHCEVIHQPFHTVLC